MNENTDTTTEEVDTEGHGVKSGRVEPAEAATEGHAIKSGRVEPADADTEGHAARRRF